MKRNTSVRWALLGLMGGALLAPSALAQDPNFKCVLDPNLPPPLQLSWELLQWAYMSFDASESNPTGLVGVPPESNPSPASVALQPGERRIVLFGDMMATDTDTVPKVHTELRSLFASADMVLGNVEAPIMRGPVDVKAKQAWNFRASTGYLKSFFAQYCADPHRVVFTVANNHAADNGRWPETVKAIVPEGAPLPPRAPGELPPLVVRGVVGKHPAAHEDVDIFDLGGFKVGVVGWTHVENCQLANAWRTEEEVLGVDWAKVKRERGIDLLVGAVHWDTQFYRFPKADTQLWAKEFVASGFDLIAGSHPTVMQPAEIFPNAETAPDMNDGMVFYSLAMLHAGGTGNMFVPVVEVIVNAQGKLARYKVHTYVQRKAEGTLTDTWCPLKDAGLFGRWMPDTVRSTQTELVPLRMLSNASGTRDKLEKPFKLIFPSR